MMQKTFTGVPGPKKKDAEQSAAAEALRQLQIAASWAVRQKKKHAAAWDAKKGCGISLGCFCWKFVGWRTFRRFLWEGIQPTKRGTN